MPKLGVNPCAPDLLVPFVTPCCYFAYGATGTDWSLDCFIIRFDFGVDRCV